MKPVTKPFLAEIPGNSRWNFPTLRSVPRARSRANVRPGASGPVPGASGARPCSSPGSRRSGSRGPPETRRPRRGWSCAPCSSGRNFGNFGASLGHFGCQVRKMEFISIFGASLGNFGCKVRKIRCVGLLTWIFGCNRGLNLPPKMAVFGFPFGSPLNHQNNPQRRYTEKTRFWWAKAWFPCAVVKSSIVERVCLPEA